jgi:hypothetical protein
MATWTDISNTVLEPGDPIRSVDIIAIKENITALSEGASGAPKIQSAALAEGAITTSMVLAATAGAAVGAVGTYAMLWSANGIAAAAGETKAGSALRYAGFTPSFGGSASGATDAFPTNATHVMQMRGAGGTPAGTWRAMGRDASRTFSDGYVNQINGGMTLWLRIS